MMSMARSTGQTFPMKMVVSMVTAGSATASTSACRFTAPDWNAICQAAEAFLNTGQFSLLRNPNLVKGILADGVLTLEMDRALAYMVLNTPETVQKLRQAANACGSTVDVRIVPSEAQAQTERRSLEELARIENVEFK